MSLYLVFDSKGQPARDFVLRHAHAFGPDDLPVQATITVSEGFITLDRASPEATGLCVQIEVPPVDQELLAQGNLAFASSKTEGSMGLLTLQTALLPPRGEPYVLALELARRQIMLFLNKLEDWGLFDEPTAEPVLREFELARQCFTAALVASRKTAPAHAPDPRAEAHTMAMKALALTIDAGERLAVLDAVRQLPSRLNGKMYQEAIRHYVRATAETPAAGAAIALSTATGVFLSGSPQIGIAVEPTQFAEPLHRVIPLIADFISIPMRWSEMEPTEGKYSFVGTDRWIEWAVRGAKLPVVAGPLLDFRAGCVPEWLSIWENDYETLRELVVEHVQQVVTRYRRTVSRWTVAGGLHVNGNIKLSVDQVIDITRVAVSVVRKLHPQARVQLGIDEPWGEYHAARKRSLPPLLYADAMIQVGLNIDALGLRVAMGQHASGRMTRDLASLSALLDRYAQFNRPISITAVGVPSGMTPNGTPEHDRHEGGTWRVPWSDAWQADWMSQAMAIMLAKPYVQSVCWQQLADAPPNATTGEMPMGGLMTSAGVPKASMQRLMEIHKAVREGKAPVGIANLGQF